MIEKADSTSKAFELLAGALLHHNGPQSAVRAVARLVHAGSILLPNERLASSLEDSASGFRVLDEKLIVDAIAVLRTGILPDPAPSGIIVRPHAANENGYVIPSLAKCRNN